MESEGSKGLNLSIGPASRKRQLEKKTMCETEIRLFMNFKLASEVVIYVSNNQSHLKTKKIFNASGCGICNCIFPKKDKELVKQSSSLKCITQHFKIP